MDPNGVRSSFDRLIEIVGEPVTIRRYTGTTPRVPADVGTRAKGDGYTPEELVGAIKQGDVRYYVELTPLEQGNFPLPILKNDKVIVKRTGKVLNVEAVDDNTLAIGGTLMYSVLQCRG